MKNIKVLLISIVVVLFFSNTSYGQDPKVCIKYQAEVFASGNPIKMDIQVWIPGSPSTIEDGWTGYLGHGQVGDSYCGNNYTCVGYGSSYDIYSVIIYDNSGGSNNAYIYNSNPTDDFDYKPYSIILHYNAKFYPMSSHNAGVEIY